MSRVKKMLWSKLKLPFIKEGRQRNIEDDSILVSKLNVNEEYKEAFRTKSYIEMCNKVQGQMEIGTKGKSSLSSPSSTPSSPTCSTSGLDIHLSDHLFEPHEETLASISANTSSDLHRHLVSYFEISLEACKVCESLLTNVHQSHIDYHSIRNVIKFIKQVPDSTSWTHGHYHAVYKNLASFALRTNPFSKVTPEKFHELHDSHVFLLRELTSQCRKTQRRTKFVKCIKRVLAFFLIAGCGALTIALVVLMIHSMIGLVAAPGVVVCSLTIFMVKKMKITKHKFDETWLEGLGAQLDIAARGVYILINDFDTISRLVQRLKDEMEHKKFVADICVRKGKNEMLKEVLKEFQMHESIFLEQLEELEKQIYLCFLDINRSRRLVVQEMTKV